MHCIINIITREKISSFRDELIKSLYNKNPVADVYNKTSLVSKPDMMSAYFHGKDNQTINYLLAEEEDHKLRIFVEGAVKTENLDQLSSGTKEVYKSLERFFKSHKIKKVSVDAMIWSEGEEVLRGTLTTYGQRVTALIRDFPVGIFVLALTLLYTFWSGKPITEGGDAVSEIGLSLMISITAFILWAFTRALFQKTELTFKIK